MDQIAKPSKKIFEKAYFETLSRVSLALLSTNCSEMTHYASYILHET